MNYFFKLLTAILLLLIYNPVWSYEKAGSDSTIDILTWNIENFPKNNSNTVQEVAQIVKDLDGDIIAVQEIASVADFNLLLNSLPEWEGILSSHVYNTNSYQKLGLLYKRDAVTIHWHQLLFENNGYAFPRPPLDVYLTAEQGGQVFDLRIIIVHLKAYSGEDNEARRRAAVESLKVYIDDQMLNGDEDDFVLLGDFNDHLEDPANDNVFSAMLNDPDNYTFLTGPLAGEQSSYIGYDEPNLIDHITMTSDARDEYGKNGSTQVIYLDRQNAGYEGLVSDHRPVLSVFTFTKEYNPEYTPISEIHDHFTDYQGQTVTVKGVVTIASGVFSDQFTSVYIQDSTGAGINIYNRTAVLQDAQQGNELEVTGLVYNFNGLHEIQYSSHRLLNEAVPLPRPRSIGSGTISDTTQNQGCWITVHGTIESMSAPPHVNMVINDGSGSGTVYFDPDAGINVSAFSVGSGIRVSGVKTVYNYQGQVQPGYQADIEAYEPAALVEIPNATAGRNCFLGSYPNPFNNRVVLNFQLNRHTATDIRIYNVRGQQVDRLINGPLAAGEHRISWQAANQPSGIYICRLLGGGRVLDTTRLILLK